MEGPLPIVWRILDLFLERKAWRFPDSCQGRRAWRILDSCQGRRARRIPDPGIILEGPLLSLSFQMDGKSTEYVGETARNTYTRGMEHMNSLRLEDKENPL